MNGAIMPSPDCQRAAEALHEGDAYRALISLAKAIRDDANQQLQACEGIIARGHQMGAQWCTHLLLLGRAARWGDVGARVQLARLPVSNVQPLTGPICIVVGTTEPHLDMSPISATLEAAFNDFRGTVISGGTPEGVSGLVGRLGTRYRGRVRTIGYVPSFARVDPRYSDIRRTSGDGFTPWEALHAWTDVLNSQIAPETVRVLGLGGGDISAVEYRMALGLGAAVGVVPELGRSAAAIIVDPDWSEHPRLERLRLDAAAIGGFVLGGRHRATGQDDDPGAGA